MDTLKLKPKTQGIIRADEAEALSNTMLQNHLRNIHGLIEDKAFAGSKKIIIEDKDGLYEDIRTCFDELGYCVEVIKNNRTFTKKDPGDLTTSWEEPMIIIVIEW